MSKEINMDIEVGDYVRTKSGEIGIFVEYRDDKFFCKIKIKNTYYTPPISTITKHSKNIIDLIEGGDFVNNYIVLDVMEDLQTGEIHLEMPSSYPKEGSCTIYNNEIETILTKEQYLQNRYKVERS